MTMWPKAEPKRSAAAERVEKDIFVKVDEIIVRPANEDLNQASFVDRLLGCCSAVLEEELVCGFYRIAGSRLEKKNGEAQGAGILIWLGVKGE